jgi:cell division protease FtsH
MSERLGNLTYGKPTGGRFLQSPFAAEERNYSEKTAELIDDEVQRLISEAYDVSRGILTARHAQLDRIAKELIQMETLDRAQLDDLLNERCNDPSKLQQTAL